MCTQDGILLHWLFELFNLFVSSSSVLLLLLLLLYYYQYYYYNMFKLLSSFRTSWVLWDRTVTTFVFFYYFTYFNILHAGIIMFRILIYFFCIFRHKDWPGTVEMSQENVTN